MRLCNVPLAFLPLCFLIAKDDTSANATASPASSEAFSSTGTRSDTLISEPPNARDEERAPGIEDVRGKNKFTTLISKTMQALWKRDTKSQLEVKAAWWRMRNVDPYTVYDNLMLNQIGENILSKPLFHVWFKYVERYNAEHPNDQVPIVRHLLTKYSENKLAMMLQQAKEEGDTLTKILARHCRMSRCQFGLQQMFAHMISTPSRSLARSGWACLRAVRALSGTLISASSTLVSWIRTLISCTVCSLTRVYLRYLLRQDDYQQQEGRRERFKPNCKPPG